MHRKGAAGTDTEQDNNGMLLYRPPSTCSLRSLQAPLQTPPTKKDGGANKPHCLTPPPPLSCPTPGKTVPRHPLGDGCQVTVSWGTALPPYMHIFMPRNCTAKRKLTVAGLSCLHAHKRCGNMHHRALKIQQPAPKQVPLWSG